MKEALTMEFPDNVCWNKQLGEGEYPVDIPNGIVRLTDEETQVTLAAMMNQSSSKPRGKVFPDKQQSKV